MVHVSAQRFERAAALLEPFVAEQPEHTDALHLLGVARLGQDDTAAALDLFERAAAVTPDDADIHNNRALALRALHRLEDAEAASRRAIELEPERPESRNSLGTVLEDQGRKDEALATYRAATEVAPGYAIGHVNTGRLLSERDELPEALASYTRATECDPSRTDAWLALGRVSTWMGDFPAAQRHLRRALLLKANDPEIREALADALQLAGSLRDAIGHYRQLIRSHPDRASALYALGCARATQREFALALPHFERAAELDPGRNEAHFQVGKAGFEIGQMTKAMSSMRRVLDGASGQLAAMTHDALATFVPGDPTADDATVLATRQAWAAHCCPPLTPEREFPARSEKLKIGYVSAFFGRRNWMKPVWGVVDHHDRSRVDVHLFSDAPRSAIGTAFRPQAGDAFHETRDLDAAEFAERVRAERIDVLVDLNGFSRSSRLAVFPHRPAPVTLTWFNNYATLAVPGLDHTVADKVVLPEGTDSAYAEQVHCVDGTYLAFDVQYPVPSVAEPPCVRRGAITFGSLCSLYKLTPEVLDAWAKIVLEVPDSRLLLRNGALSQRGTRDHVIAELARRGLARSRIALDGSGEHSSFLRTYEQIDLALDAFPYGGGTTTMEALWQGVPVLCFRGDRWAARISASLMQAAGLDEFVSPDLESHVADAITLGRDPATPERLAELRQGMRDRLRESDACATQSLAQQLETLYDRLRG